MAVRQPSKLVYAGSIPVARTRDSLVGPPRPSCYCNLHFVITGAALVGQRSSGTTYKVTVTLYNNYGLGLTNLLLVGV